MKGNFNRNLAHNFLIIGLQDYRASRFLLNNGFFMQGATLASSAVEKHLKAILNVYNIKLKAHLNNLTGFEKEF